MSGITKIIGAALAAAVLGTALMGSGTVLADTSTNTVPQAAHDRVDRSALDALRTVLDRMVDDGRMTPGQRDAVADAVRRADWDGFGVARLNEILGALEHRGTITRAQRDAIVDAVAHSDRNVDRLVRVLDRLTDRGVLSRDQRVAVIDAAHRADWDGFSIERLGDILGDLVRHGVLSAAQRDAIMDGMRR